MMVKTYSKTTILESYNNETRIVFRALDMSFNQMMVQGLTHGEKSCYSFSRRYDATFPGLYTGIVIITLWTVGLAYIYSYLAKLL